MAMIWCDVAFCPYWGDGLCHKRDIHINKNAHCMAWFSAADAQKPRISKDVIRKEFEIVEAKFNDNTSTRRPEHPACESEQREYIERDGRGKTETTTGAENAGINGVAGQPVQETSGISGMARGVYGTCVCGSGANCTCNQGSCDGFCSVNGVPTKVSGSEESTETDAPTEA